MSNDFFASLSRVSVADCTDVVSPRTNELLKSIFMLLYKIGF